jgi:hypothetical protein
VPTGLVEPRWRPHVFPSNGGDRRFYELCALAELRDRLEYLDLESDSLGLRPLPQNTRPREHHRSHQHC